MLNKLLELLFRSRQRRCEVGVKIDIPLVLTSNAVRTVMYTLHELRAEYPELCFDVKLNQNVPKLHVSARSNQVVLAIPELRTRESIRAFMSNIYGSVNLVRKAGLVSISKR